MTAPIGAVVSLTYDGAALLEVDDVLRTETGRCYVIQACRRQMRGLHRGRWHLRCLVTDVPPPGAVVRPLFWHPRRSRRRGT